MSTPTLVWRDPPKIVRRSNAELEIHAILPQLKERPGQWAEVWRGVGAYAATHRREILRQLGCEVAGSRGDSDAERIVFARFVGEPE